MSEDIKNTNTENEGKTTAGENTTAKAEPKATEVKGTYVHTFKKPFEFEGKKYQTLNFYWDGLKGADMIAIENEMQAMNEYALAPEISAGFLCRMSAKAAGVGSDVIENLPIGEFSKIKNAARDFLINSGY